MVYKIEGTLIGGKQFVRFADAASDSEATKILLAAMDNVASWTIVQIVEDPEDTTIQCGHCGERVRNPQLWI